MSSRFDSFFQRISETTGLISQTKLASALGVNRSAITQAKKHDSIPDKWVLKLSRQYGLHPDWIEEGVGDKFLTGSHGTAFKEVPKMKARLSAGGGSFEVEDEIEGYYAFQEEWLTKKGNSERMVLMDIFGSSMEPELKDGDTVLIDQSQKAILAGAIYAVGIDDTVMIKRVEKYPGRLVLLSDNEAYSPISLQGDEIISVRVIGKVIWICREFR